MDSRAAAIGIFLLWLMVSSVLALGYGMNIYKLTQCDFEAPYKAEVLHTVGLIPVVGVFTGYMEFGK